VLFQTSSNKKFNIVFHNEEVTAYKNSITEGDKAYVDYDTLYVLANQVYTSILSSKEGWTGVPSTECWKCGNSCHGLND